MEHSCDSLPCEGAITNEATDVSTDVPMGEDVPADSAIVLDIPCTTEEEVKTGHQVSEVHQEDIETIKPSEGTEEMIVTEQPIPGFQESNCEPEFNNAALKDFPVNTVNPSSDTILPINGSVAQDSCSIVDNSEVGSKSNNATVVQPPEYNFENIMEIMNTGSLFTPEQYLDSCKWSPDGSCLLTCCADRRLRLFDLPGQLYTTKEFDIENKIKEPLKPSLTISENGAIYDYEWFPFMSSWSPETACFISASSSAPVHLIDAFTGTVRASYIGYNNVFEIASCFGLTFTFDGGKIFCGYRNMIKIFDVAVPGTTCQTLNSKRLNEQSGYISCIAQNPSMHCLFAAGSFSRTIGLYTENGDAVCLLKGQRNGLTSLSYSHDGTKLFSGSRMDHEILCWDLRNPGQVLHVLPRVMDTNQRIRLTVSADGKHLLTGGTDGVVRVWKLDELATNQGTCEPTVTLKAHNDCVNGVSLNSRYPVLATSSGKRHTPDLVSDDESDRIFSYENFSKKTENRVTLWWLGPQKLR